VASREHLAKNLKRLRTVKGLSQEALADAAGIDRTYVSALERQKYSLSIDRSTKSLHPSVWRHMSC